MGTKPVYKILWFGQSGVTDKSKNQPKKQWVFRSSGCGAVSLGQFPEIFKDP